MPVMDGDAVSEKSNQKGVRLSVFILMGDGVEGKVTGSTIGRGDMPARGRPG